MMISVRTEWPTLRWESDLREAVQFLHDGNLVDGKNQVADGAGILKNIGCRILNFRIMILESRQTSASFIRQDIMGLNK